MLCNMLPSTLGEVPWGLTSVVAGKSVGLLPENSTDLAEIDADAPLLQGSQKPVAGEARSIEQDVSQRLNDRAGPPTSLMAASVPSLGGRHNDHS
jgi:hypothetical protein